MTPRSAILDVFCQEYANDSDIMDIEYMSRLDRDIEKNIDLNYLIEIANIEK